MTALKKTLSILLTVFLLFTCLPMANVGAVGTPTVSASAVSAQAGNTVRIPVNISDNTGVMGWMLTFTYDADVLSPISVERGEALTSGTLNDNIDGDALPGQFKAVWSDTANRTYNGTLLYITFSVSEKAVADTEIEIGYVQYNTFDENFNNVSLLCKPISVQITNPKFDGAPQITLQGGSVTAGDTVAVTMRIQNIGTLTAGALCVSFDAQNFSFVSAQSASAAVSISAEAKDGKVNLQVAGLSATQENTVFATLYFKSDAFAAAKDYTFSGTYGALTGASAILFMDGSVCVAASATSNAVTVASDADIRANVGETVDVPIYLTHNKGIMGCKLLFTYDATQLEAVEILAGNFGGTFETSVSKTAGSCFMIWCSTENVFVNSRICTVRFKGLTNTEVKSPVRISYSQADTFNENWEDVQMLCTDASVWLNHIPQVTALTLQTKPTKLQYELFEDFDATGMVLKATYDDGTVETVTADGGYTVSGFNTQSVGTKTVSIQYSGKTVTFDILVAHNHAYGAWVTDKAATCTEQGTKHRTCAVCGARENGTIPALGHNYSTEWTVDVEATCTAVGSKSHHCTRCDAKTDITEIPATGHNYGAWATDKAATCTEQGTKHRTCAVCGARENGTIPVLGHNYSPEWTVDVEATCTAVGSKSHHCTRCDAKTDITEIPATGHNYGAWVTDKAATCTEQGTKHRTCTVCGARENGTIPALGHNYSTEWTVDVEATCTAVGSKSHHCTRCDAKTDITEIPATGHNYGAWVTDKAATCTDQGTKHRTCAACGARENGTIPALGHNYSTEWTVDVEATCTEAGSKSHHCTRCDAKTDVTEIPATGHNYGAWAMDKAATCTEQGTKHRTCAVCGARENGTIPALGHNYSTEWTVDVEATCTEAGSKSHHCTRCDAKTDVTEIPATGHNFGEWRTVQQPTATEEGLEEHTCETCGITEQRAIPPISVPLGDVNQDGKVNAVDARWVLQYASGARELTETQKVAANVSGDNKINAVDARWILQIASGLRTL